MGAKLGGKASFSDINMTPLIDIVLVVLIIMMVSIPIKVEQLGIKLPAKVDNPPPPDPNAEQLVVAMYEDQTIALNRTIMDKDRLFGEVTLRLRSMSNKTVFIDAAAKLNYGEVIDMVDHVKEAGAEKVSFAKLKPEGPTQATAVASGALPRGVRPGSPGISAAADGGQWMTEKQAADAFEPILGRVRGCYDLALTANPALPSGRLLVSVDVGPQGQIMGSGIVSSTMAAPELDACILALVPGIRFAPLGEQHTARIHYPLLFSPG